jgi:hypothetical protein
VGVVVPTEALTSGKVRLAPSSFAEAPTIVDSLAFGPRVTVLVQPAPRSVTVATATSSFFIFSVLVPNLVQGLEIIDKTYVMSSVIICMKVTLNGLKIVISQDKVVIYDVDNNLTKSGAVSTLKYLKAEGFLFHDQVFLEVIGPEDEDEEWDE